MKKPVLHTSLKNPANHPSQGAAKAVAKQIKANNPPVKTNKPKPKPSTGAKKKAVSTTKSPMKSGGDKQARPITKIINNHTYRDGATVYHGSTGPSSKPKSVIKAHTEYELRNAIKLIRETVITGSNVKTPSVISARNPRTGGTIKKRTQVDNVKAKAFSFDKNREKKKPDGIVKPGDKITESNVVPLITNNAKPKIKRPKPPGKPANDTNVKTPKPANDTFAWPKGLRPPENIKERKMDDELKKYIADLVKEGFSDDEIMHIMKLDEVLSKDDVIKAARSATSKESEVDKKLKKPVQSKSVSMEDKVRASILSGGKLKEQKDLYSVGSSRVESSQELHSNVMEALKTVNEFNKHK